MLALQRAKHALTSAALTLPMHHKPSAIQPEPSKSTADAIMVKARYRLTGVVKGRLYVVVYTPRHGAVRIISAHKANQRETRRYEDSACED
jgi:uncharacterized DUF497 family protein